MAHRNREHQWRNCMTDSIKIAHTFLFSSTCQWKNKWNCSLSLHQDKMTYSERFRYKGYASVLFHLPLTNSLCSLPPNLKIFVWLTKNTPNFCIENEHIFECVFCFHCFIVISVCFSLFLFFSRFIQETVSRWRHLWFYADFKTNQ